MSEQLIQVVCNHSDTEYRYIIISCIYLKIVLPHRDEGSGGLVGGGWGLRGVEFVWWSVFWSKRCSTTRKFEFE